MRKTSEKMRRIAFRTLACAEVLDWLYEYEGEQSVEAILAAMPDESWREWWDAIMRAGATVHPTARVSRKAWLYPGCTIGPGVVIKAGAQIGEGVRIGEGAQIGAWVTIWPDVAIGKGVRIGDGAQIGKGAKIGAGVRIGAGEAISPGMVMGRADIIRYEL